MGTVLVTGFEPFGGRGENMSWQIVRGLPDEICGRKLETLRLPVVYGKAAEQAAARAEAIGAELVLCVGEAAGRSALTVEQIAVNMRGARIPDNEGNVPAYTPIAPDGADGVFASFPVIEYTERLKQEGFAAEVSWSAGTYVCNDLMYGVLHHFRGTDTRCGFVHVQPEGDEETQRTCLLRLLELIFA